MRGIALLFMICILSVWQSADATAIDPGQSVSSVPLNPGSGLSGSFYKFNGSNIGSIAQTNQLIAAAGGTTATFTSNTICFPDCAGNSISDSTSLSGLLNGNASNFSYTVAGASVTAVDHSAMILAGYIAIATPGAYTFYLGSDDGSQLLIGGQTIINNDGAHAFGTDSGSASFTAAGLYAINIEYFENGGNTGLDFYASNGSGACIIGRAANCAAGSVSTGMLYSSTTVPEPASLTIFGAGLCALALISRRRFTA